MTGGVLVLAEQALREHEGERTMGAIPDSRGRLSQASAERILAQIGWI